LISTYQKKSEKILRLSPHLYREVKEVVDY